LHATKEASLLKRQRRAPWRARNQVNRAAGRTAIFLLLPAIILLAGSAIAAAGTHHKSAVTHHQSKAAKAHSATRTTALSADGHHTSSSPAGKSPSSAHQATSSHKTAAAEAATHKLAAKKTVHHAAAKAPALAAKTSAVRHIAARQQPAPRPVRVALGTFMVTCYDLTGPTASGAMAGPESVAVDPSVIPLGTTIYVPGIGNRIADDTGGMIIGDHIDIWEPSYDQCVDWGVRYLPIYRVQ
jgi:3D (Asp-Asp-Asp) domain-containing protein